MNENPELVRQFHRSLAESSGQATNLWLELEEGSTKGAKTLKRLLHTVKGEAHLLGLTDIGHLAMALEELVLRAVAADAAKAAGNVVLDALEALGMIGLAEGEAEGVDLEAITKRIRVASEEYPAHTATPSRPPMRSSLPPKRVEAEEASPESTEGKEARRDGWMRVDDVIPSVNELGRLHGEQALLMPNLREAQRILRAVLAEMDPTLPPAVLGEQVIKTLGYAAEVERRLTAVRAMWSANAHAAGLALDQLSEAARRAALVSVGRLRTQLTMAVRAAAAELGKEVALVFEGDAFIDAAIARRLEAALLHAVRNSVDHGIESPSDRLASGKRGQGTIRVQVGQDANMVRAVVRDDGRGVDYAALRRKVGLAADDSTPETELIRRLFQSGVTTRDSATAISGRGIGLDVIAGEAVEAGGSVHATSITGIGFELTIDMPVVMRAEHVVPLQVGAHQVALPSRLVDRFLRVTSIETTTSGPMLKIVGDGGDVDLVPIFSLHHAFDETPPPIHGASVVVVRTSSGSGALVVDRSESPRTISFQPVSDLACDSPFVRAVAPLPDGTVRLLLDAPAILADLVASGRTVSTVTASSAERRSRVLVVEDAPVARELLCGILRSFGLVVVEAAHGKEGLDLLKQQKFDLLLSDVEMPFIGGLEMIATARETLGLTDLPVVVLTTDASEATRRRAAALGVVAFLAKQRFVEDELRAIVDRYLETA